MLTILTSFRVVNFLHEMVVFGIKTFTCSPEKKKKKSCCTLNPSDFCHWKRGFSWYLLSEKWLLCAKTDNWNPVSLSNTSKSKLTTRIYIVPTNCRLAHRDPGSHFLVTCSFHSFLFFLKKFLKNKRRNRFNVKF